VNPGERSTTEAGTTPGPQDSVGATSPPAAPRSRAAVTRRRKRSRFLIETAVILLAAILLAVLLRAFVVQTYYVPSASMAPTIEPGDRIVVSKLSYHLHGIGRGDIVVFARPPAEHCGSAPVPDLVKRVIGLPGERISSAGNQVLINGKPIAEPWLPKPDPLGKAIPPETIPANDYYVLGDNRAYSCDSRYWGPVPRSLIVGKVVAIFWPLSHLHWF
jgi:signal peptidase I